MSRIIHSSLHEVPETAISGNGIWLSLRDGRSVIDGSAGTAVACLGHRNRRVAEAIGKQADKLWPRRIRGSSPQSLRKPSVIFCWRMSWVD